MDYPIRARCGFMPPPDEGDEGSGADALNGLCENAAEVQVLILGAIVPVCGACQRWLALLEKVTPTPPIAKRREETCRPT
jgi:hypothetical protein